MKFDKAKNIIPIFIVFVLVTILLGAYGIFEISENKTSLHYALYETLKVFFIDDNFEEISKEFKKSINWQMWVSRLLGAFAAFSAVLAIIGRIFTNTFAKHSSEAWSDHTTVIGGGVFATTLANRLVEEGKKCIHLSENFSEIIMNKSLIQMPFIGNEITELVKKAINNSSKIIITAKSDIAALETGVKLQKLYSKPEIIIRVFDIYRARNFEFLKPESRLRMYSMAEAGSAEIIRRHYPFLIAEDLGQTRIHIAIIGDEFWIEAIISEITISCLTKRFGKPIFSIFINDEIAFKEQLIARYPEIEMEMSLNFYNLEAIKLANLLKNSCSVFDKDFPLTAVYSAFLDPNISFAYAMNVKHWSVNFDNSNFPIFIRMDNGEDIEKRKDGHKLSENEIVPFGSLIDICKASDFTSDKLEQAAKNWHNIYEKIISGKKNTDADWDNLSEDKRNSNRRAVKHFFTKLFDAGFNLREWMTCNDVWNGIPALAPNEKFLIDNEMKDRQTELEHERWNAERRMLGWRHADGKKNDIMKTHPSLLEFRELDLETASFDKIFIEGLENELKRDTNGLRRN